MKKLFFSMLIALIASACVQLPKNSDQQTEKAPELPKVNAEFAAKYAIYAMVASNTYHKDKTERVRFPVEVLGWQQVDSDDQPTDKPTGTRWSGLAWDVYEKTNSNEVIFSFRGTDSKLDYLTANAMPWPFAIQYQQAQKIFLEYKRKHSNKKITLTGHSLGGGIAAGLSVREGIDTIIFDPSPRMFDGWGDKHLHADVRIVIFQKGEILDKVRKLWPKLIRTFPEESFFMTEFDFEKYNAHRMDQLALGLLNLAATDNANGLAIIAEKTKMSIPSASDAAIAELIRQRR